MCGGVHATHRSIDLRQHPKKGALESVIEHKTLQRERFRSQERGTGQACDWPFFQLHPVLTVSANMIRARVLGHPSPTSSRTSTLLQRPRDLPNKSLICLLTAERSSVGNIGRYVLNTSPHTISARIFSPLLNMERTSRLVWLATKVCSCSSLKAGTRPRMHSGIAADLHSA